MIEDKKCILVWAKLKGYPWWPGRVQAQSFEAIEQSEKVCVTFIDENSYSFVSKHSLLPFVQNFQKNSNKKNKKLTNAIKIALKEHQAVAAQLAAHSELSSLPAIQSDAPEPVLQQSKADLKQEQVRESLEQECFQKLGTKQLFLKMEKLIDEGQGNDSLVEQLRAIFQSATIQQVLQKQLLRLLCFLLQKMQCLTNPNPSQSLQRFYKHLDQLRQQVLALLFDKIRKKEQVEIFIAMKAQEISKSQVVAQSISQSESQSDHQSLALIHRKVVRKIQRLVKLSLCKEERGKSCDLALKAGEQLTALVNISKERYKKVCSELIRRLKSRQWRDQKQMFGWLSAKCQ